MAVLGLLSGVDPPPALQRLLHALGGTHRLVDPTDGSRVDAVLWNDDVEPDGSVPVARWAVPGPGRCDVVVGADPALLESDLPPGCTAVVVPEQGLGLQVGSARHVSPYLRRRLRAARGLTPAPLVIVGDWDVSWDGHAMEPEVLGPALASAEVVLVTGIRTVQALAWGAPLVTSQADADALGARAGRDCLVGADHSSRLELAHGLMGDEHQQAALSWAGRLLFERTQSMQHAVLAVEVALGLDSGPGGWLWRLDALGTGADAQPRRRATNVMCGFRPAPRARPLPQELP